MICAERAMPLTALTREISATICAYFGGRRAPRHASATVGYGFTLYAAALRFNANTAATIVTPRRFALFYRRHERPPLPPPTGIR